MLPQRLVDDSQFSNLPPPVISILFLERKWNHCYAKKKKKKNVSEGNKCSETWLGWNFPCIYTFEISVLKLSTYAWGGRGNNQMLENMPSSVPLFEGVKMLFSSHSPCYFGCQVVSLPRFHIKNNCGDFFFPAHAGGGIPVVPFFLQKANMRYSPVLI